VVYKSGNNRRDDDYSTDRERRWEDKRGVVVIICRVLRFLYKSKLHNRSLKVEALTV
jgi:hypothetical protein